jgi:hypothetical protein
MSIYAFCDGCDSKVYTYDDGGKLIDHTCPARYNPFDEKIIFDDESGEFKKVSRCTRHNKFMALEKQKMESKVKK